MLKKSTSKIELFWILKKEDKITYKESPFKSTIKNTKDKLPKSGNKLIKKSLYYVEEMKKLTESQVRNTKEKLIKFRNELIRKNRIKKDNDIYNAWYYGSITYSGIKDIRYLFNDDEDEDIKYIRYLFNEDNDEDEQSPFKSIIQDIKDKFSKSGDKLIKNGLYYVEEMKSLGSAEIKNIKEKLIIFKDELIRKNRINDRIKKDFDDYKRNIKYRAIKNIRYLFNEEDIYSGINDIKYLFNENEEKIANNSNIRCLFNENEDKESPFKSKIEDIKKGLYYFEEINNLSTSDIKKIKE